MFTVNAMLTYCRTDQNVNNQNLTEISQISVYICACIHIMTGKQVMINLTTGGHGHVICMPVYNVHLNVLKQ